MFVLFFLVWLLLSGEVTAHSCLWGAAASLLMAWFCRRILGYERRFLGPAGLWARICYLAHLLAEMLRAGFVVMRMIYVRPREIRPKLVRFRTPLRMDRHRALLANSITLTAGTITVEAEGDTLLVHTLDVSLAEGIEDSTFQRRLERLEA